MEVEVKIKLPDSNTHQKISSLLSPHHIKTHLQENFFFDGSNSELSASRAILRLRFYDGNAKCVVSLKAKAVIIDGVSRVEEIEEEIDVLVGRACVSDPWRLSSVVECGLIRRVLEEFGVKEEEGFVCLGSFKNVRAVYEWKKGLVLELDETQYEFGRSYEIECESEDPETAKKLLEEFLGENGIEYEYSKVSKFAVFRMGKLPE